MTLWGAESSKPFIIIAVIAGLGKVLAPAIALPFITPTIKGSSHDYNYTNISVRNKQSVQVYHGYVYKDSNIQPIKAYQGPVKAYQGHVYKVYLIISGLIIGGTLFCTYLIRITKPSDTSLNYSINKVREVHKPANSSQSRFSVILYCAVFFIYFFCIDIVIEGLLNFVYSIALESTYFNSEQALILNIFIQCIALISKLVILALLNCVSIKNLMNILIISSSLSGVFMSIFGLSSNMSLCVTVSIFIFTATPMYAGGFAYANEYLNITGLISGLFASGVSLGYFASAWMTATILRDYGRSAVLWEFTVTTTFQSIILIGIWVTSVRESKVKASSSSEVHPLFADTKDY